MSRISIKALAKSDATKDFGIIHRMDVYGIFTYFFGSFYGKCSSKYNNRPMGPGKGITARS